METQHSHLPEPRPENISVSEARELYNKDLDWQTVLALFKLPSTKPSIPWLSQRCNISTDKIAKIIDGLLALKMIERTSTGYIFVSDTCEDYQKCPGEQLASRLRNTQQVLNQFDPDHSIGRVITAALASNKPKATEMIDRIKDIIKEYDNDSSLYDNDGDVWGLSMVLVRLTNEVTK